MSKPTWRLSRRGFFIGVGAAGAGLLLGATVGLPALRLTIAQTLARGDGRAPSLDRTPTTWFEISPDNSVRLFVPKVEMGQGVHTALAQIAADELEIEWDRLTVIQASGERGPYDTSGTSGSTSVSSMYAPIREIAATMREMLRREGAAHLGIDLNDAVAERGEVFSRANPQSRTTYGQIVERTPTWTIPEDAVALKTREQFRYIGQPVARVDFPAKLQGEAIYGYDARLPDMLYGAVARPPQIGATLSHAAAGNAAQAAGVAAVLAESDFAGVAATSRAEAYAALGALDLAWTEPQTWQQADIEAQITVGQGKGVTIQKAGDASAQLQRGPVVEAEFRTPMAVHAHLEAQAALADVRADSARVWVSTQFPDLVRKDVAKATSLKTEQVIVYPTFLGGGFGRKSGLEPAVEAARLSKAAGRPVHVGWSRTEDFRHGYVRPPTHHRLRAVLDGTRIQALEHQQASGAVAFGFLPGFLTAVMGADFGAWRGSMVNYNVPHVNVVTWLNELPVRTGWWRGLGLLANIFALESFIDELAHAAGSDPLQFRLANLPESEDGKRVRAVLECAAERAGWGAAPQGRAQGVACCIDSGTAVAQIAEVSVENGAIRVHRVSAAVDPGLVVNPDGASAQTQGNIVMGLSSTLFEELTVRDGQFSASNFDGYPIITMRDTPQIDVDLIDSGDVPHGMGEPPIGPVAAAVANAVFALTGRRLRRLPLRLDEGEQS